MTPAAIVATLRRTSGQLVVMTLSLRKARNLSKADVSVTGPDWSDGRIAEALETSPSTVFRARQGLMEKGLEVAPSRKRRDTPPKPPIFDGEAEVIFGMTAGDGSQSDLVLLVPAIEKSRNTGEDRGQTTRRRNTATTKNQPDTFDAIGIVRNILWEKDVYRQSPKTRNHPKSRQIASNQC